MRVRIAMVEYLDVVDEHNRVIGRATFRECHQRGWRHRGASVLVFRDDSLSEILVQKRSPRVVIEPGKLIMSASGHVSSGENHEQGALRELAEELFHGRKAPKITLTPICTYPMSDSKNNNELVALFCAIHPGPFTPDPEEAVDLFFTPLTEMLKDMDVHPRKYAKCFHVAMEELDKSGFLKS